MELPYRDFQMIHLTYIPLHFAQILGYFPATYTIFLYPISIALYPKWFPKKSRILKHITVAHSILKKMYPNFIILFYNAKMSNFFMFNFFLN